MRYEMLGGEAFPMLMVHLEQGESIKAESGAMVAMSEGCTLKGKMDGGILKGIARRFSGESFFLQQIEAEKKAGWAMLATSIPGAISDIELDGSYDMICQKNAFMAGTAGIDVSTKAQSLGRAMFGGEGFFVVKIGGKGHAFLSSFGGIYPVEVPAGETVIIDNGHLVAWPSTMKYDITKGASSWMSAMTSGEGLACRFTGPGTVLVQSRNPVGFGGWLMNLLPLPVQQ